MNLKGKYGFNFQWMMEVGADGPRPRFPDEKALDFLAKHGFNFVRLPSNYWIWTRDFEYFNPDESMFKYIDEALSQCQARGIHLSLNLHRVPGYCINGWELEKDNLWTDLIAQDAFLFNWTEFARRYLEAPAEDLSFDLVNEPPAVGERGFTRAQHEAVIRKTVSAVREVDPKRPIVIDGLAGGHLALPELADLGVIHSGRGYQPMAVSHFEASWWCGHVGLPTPVYPGFEWDGRTWDRVGLEEFYQPWRDVEARGVGIHIGECGCYDRTPNDVAIRWLRDLFGIYKKFGWGFSVWNFEGAFGIIGHRRGAKFEMLDGYLVDREYLDILKESMRG